MALFEEQLNEIMQQADAWRADGLARELSFEGREPWPEGPSLVLEEDTALELGNPAVASLSVLLWSEEDGVEDGRITLVGPDVAETTETSIPFAQVVVVSGRFENEYESYRDIRDAVYDTRLEGFSTRTMPSKQSLWCRVSSDAAGRGFSLADLGASLIEALKELDEVEAAEVMFITSSAEHVKSLTPAARGAQRVVDALMMMYQEDNYDCETCEYQDVCDTVMDLKKIRQRLDEMKRGSGAR
jgi:CO dehydrogenase/acetyl-CoA synthase beta subunit